MKKARPFSDYEWQYGLDLAKGLLTGTAHNPYKSRKQAAVFLNSIADIERQRIRELYDKSHFLSIITDGTTDTSVTETEMIFTRTAQKGLVQCRNC